MRSRSPAAYYAETYFPSRWRRLHSHMAYAFVYQPVMTYEMVAGWQRMLPILCRTDQRAYWP
jgi:hypothetical protein